MTRLIAIAAPVADTWGMHDGDMGAGWWIVMMIGMIVFWAAVILAVVWLVRGGLERRGPAPHMAETPLETLDRRLAEGAISPEEYTERRRLLLDEHGIHADARQRTRA